MISSKNIFALGLTLFSANAFAQTTQTVLERGDRFKPIYVSEEMPYLVSDQKFDGKYFKIVVGKSNEAISLNEADSTLRLKAATTYFHLNRARDFWVNQMNSEHVKNLGKMTIRLEITNKFSDLGHFQHDSIEPQFNNALSIPAGEPMEGVEGEPWGTEIWFRPVKKIRSEELPQSGLGAEGNPLTKYIAMLSEPIKSATVNRFIQTTLQQIFTPQTLRTPYQTSILRQAGTIALTSLVLEGSKRADRLFLEKYYYLDTAMIPEIVYHEFSHIALSDYLAVSLSTPVLEGMADYFAAEISGNPHIATKIKKYSLSMPKNGKNKTLYNPYLELNVLANSDFVLSVLWNIKLAFPEIADQLVFDARTRLQTETSDIKHDLIGSLLESCSKICIDPRADRMKMREIFEQKGF